MDNRLCIVIANNDVRPILQKSNSRIYEFASHSTANIQVHYLMHNENESLFMKKIYWKGKYYVQIDSEVRDRSGIEDEAGENMSISKSMFEEIASGKTLDSESRSYEIEIKNGKYIGFCHLIFETGLQVLEYTVDEDELNDKNEPMILDYLRDLYELPEEVVVIDDSNWMYINEWTKKYSSE